MGIEFSQRIIVTVTIDFAAWAFMVDNAENQSLHPCSPRLDAGTSLWLGSLFAGSGLFPSRPGHTRSLPVATNSD